MLLPTQPRWTQNKWRYATLRTSHRRNALTSHNCKCQRGWRTGVACLPATSSASRRECPWPGCRTCRVTAEADPAAATAAAPSSLLTTGRLHVREMCDVPMARRIWKWSKIQKSYTWGYFPSKHTVTRIMEDWMCKGISSLCIRKEIYREQISSLKRAREGIFFLPNTLWRELWRIKCSKESGVYA
jgi:hypothetical protein